MLPSTRVRQQRPHQIPLEEPRTAGPFHSGTSAFSWVILMGGMLLAVAGVVHAAWPSSEDQGTAAPSIAQDVLNQQIAQLKAELDKERAEKTELMDNMAAAKPPAAEPVRVAVQKVTQTVAEDSDPPQAQAQVAELQVPESPEAQSAEEEESSLPQPMAPSVELMLSDVPVSAVPVDSSAGASAPSGFGIHLASFVDRTMAERGWELLQRNHPSALGQLKPRVEEAKDDRGKTVFLLIAGPFDTEEMAAAHCRKINTQVVFCKPRPYNGSEITAALPQ
jgi:hypothetical protein